MGLIVVARDSGVRYTLGLILKKLGYENILVLQDMTSVYLDYSDFDGVVIFHAHSITQELCEYITGILKNTSVIFVGAVYGSTTCNTVSMPFSIIDISEALSRVSE
ncbi:MAG: hypothetical protein OEX81_01640 [Candidatus Pacebacteria bacterium]|nr:hypothetical protein [Candidatus Paceibacterota bacterium]